MSTRSVHALFQDTPLPHKFARLRVRAHFAKQRDGYKQCGLGGLLDTLWEPAHVWERCGKTENYTNNKNIHQYAYVRASAETAKQRQRNQLHK